MKAKRNGIIEIARFLFAFFILFYHNLFVVELSVFNNANYFVDFFFLLIGFYLLLVFKRYENKHPVKSTFELVYDRLKKIGIPLLIAYGCNLAFCLISEPIQIKVHYLWFIHIMLIAYILYYALYRLIRKNEKWFVISMAIVFGVTFLMRICPHFYYYDELRGLSMISLGVLLSKVPKLKIEKQKYSILIVICVSLLILAGLYVSSLDLTKKKVVEFISDIVLFPAFIYFALNINFKSKVTDVLGLSSDFIYIYQPVCVLMSELGVSNSWILFGTIILLTIVTTITLRFIEYKRYKSSDSLNQGA